MTPLLQQAREALAPFAAQFVSETGACHSELTDAKNCGRCSKILAARSVIASLDSYEAMSPYDKAVEALAPYLPDGFVAQDKDDSTALGWFEDEPDSSLYEGWMPTELGGYSEIDAKNLPRCPDWRTSLREIRAGRVVPQGEGGQG